MPPKRTIAGRVSSFEGEGCFYPPHTLQRLDTEEEEWRKPDGEARSRGKNFQSRKKESALGRLNLVHAEVKVSVLNLIVATQICYHFWRGFPEQSYISRPGELDEEDDMITNLD